VTRYNLVLNNYFEVGLDLFFQKPLKILRKGWRWYDDRSYTIIAIASTATILSNTTGNLLG
jgi:hypothetical protein